MLLSSYAHMVYVNAVAIAMIVRIVVTAITLMKVAPRIVMASILGSSTITAIYRHAMLSHLLVCHG